LADDALYEGDSNLRIRVAFDPAAKTITVSDNGIGMSRSEVVDNLGTIARSGTRQFLSTLTGDQAKDARLIGQFGVGFYSAFIVADRVSVTTRRAGLGPEHGVRWESDGKGEYSLETVAKPGRGTDVVMHLREDAEEFLDAWRLRNIIRKYSDHITLPIVMKHIDKDEDESVNSASALWVRPRNEIRPEEYDEFYKHVAHDFEPPLAHVHSRVEGKLEYILLLYVPARAPYDLWDRDRRHGIKLYVKRVFIMDDAEKLMPNYLRFVRGVVDSSDLPLNISREILQHSKDIDAMRNGAVRKVLDLLEDTGKKEPEKYAAFWNEFGKAMKEGIVEDAGNRDRIAALLRFSSTHSDTAVQDVSLSQYMARMKDGQEKIYYVTADTFAAARNSPHLEIFRKKGIEVLLLHDRIDEWLVTHLTQFDGKPLQSVSRGELDLGALEDKEEKEQKEKNAAQYDALIERIRKSLGDLVKDVRVTHRLTNSPACLVADAGSLNANFERMLKAAGQDVPKSRPILEVNTVHPIVSRMSSEGDEGRFTEWTRILYDQALLSEGGELEDPASFVARLNSLLLELMK
jgi:molecular chaperone HtpG